MKVRPWSMADIMGFSNDEDELTDGLTPAGLRACKRAVLFENTFIPKSERVYEPTGGMLSSQYDDSDRIEYTRLLRRYEREGTYPTFNMCINRARRMVDWQKMGLAVREPYVPTEDWTTQQWAQEIWRLAPGCLRQLGSMLVPKFVKEWW